MTLAAYITSNFGQVKTQLGWSDSLQIAAITEKTLEMYGVSTEAEATNASKLHALADVAVWRQALNDVSLDYNFSADGASYSRSQQADMIRENLQAAETAALVYLPNYSILVSHSDDHPEWTE
jgi:hypothetical protein